MTQGRAAAPCAAAGARIGAAVSPKAEGSMSYRATTCKVKGCNQTRYEGVTNVLCYEHYLAYYRAAMRKHKAKLRESQTRGAA